MDCSLPGSSVHRISQARVLDWVSISFSRGVSWPRDQSPVSCIARRFIVVFFLTNESPGKPYSYIFTLFLCSIWYCSASFLSKAFSLSLHDLAFSSIFSFAGYLASVILLKVGVLQGSPQAPWLVPYTWFSWVISSTPMVSMMSRLIKYKSTYLIIYLFFEHLTLIITY